MCQANLTLEVITPMYLRRIEGEDPEWRLSSIKGIMRFWFCAALGAYVSPEKDGEKLNLLTLENMVFGSTSRKSPVILKKIKQDFKKNSFSKKSSQDLLYLAGPAIQKEKFFIDINSTFTFNLSAPEPYYTLALSSLWLASYFGGLGARSRRGFGSFSIKFVGNKPSISLEFEPEETDDPEKFARFLKTNLNKILSFIKGEFLKQDYVTWKEDQLPTFPCFRKGFWEATVKRLDSCKDANKALSQVGNYLRSFRSTGDFSEKKRKTLDYETISEIFASSEKKEIVLQNLVFGLPLNFVRTIKKGKKKEIKVKKGFELKVQDKNISRRASPLFLSISKGKNTFFLIATGFNEKFLEENVKIKIFKVAEEKKEKEKPLSVKVPEDTKGIFEFIKKLQGVSFSEVDDE